MRDGLIILQTSRLQLRHFLPGDVDGLARILCDAETMRYYPFPFTRRDVVDWIDRNRRRYEDDGHGLWAMVLTSGAEMIGDCGIVRQKVGEVEEIEIAYHLRRDFWGQGLATEAAAACRDYGFNWLKVDRLISLIRPENLPSRRVAEKNGMTIWKEIMWQDMPHLVYAIHRDEYRP
jgi:[ribosomal protein S5]-alanine N-acetyltransferase